jgi:hypothetical protein
MSVHTTVGYNDFNTLIKRTQKCKMQFILIHVFQKMQKKSMQKSKREGIM